MGYATSTRVQAGLASLVVGVLGLVLGAPAAVAQVPATLVCPDEVVADSVADFSGVAFIPGDFEQLPNWRPGWRCWELTRKVYWTILCVAKVHPNGTNTSGGRMPELQWVVRRWVRDCNMTADLCGDLAKVRIVSGDGVDAFLFVDGVVVWCGVVNTTEHLRTHYASTGGPLILIAGSRERGGSGAPAGLGALLRYTVVAKTYGDPTGRGDFSFFVPVAAAGLEVHYTAIDLVRGEASNAVTLQY